MTYHDIAGVDIAHAPQQLVDAVLLLGGVVGEVVVHRDLDEGETADMAPELGQVSLKLWYVSKSPKMKEKSVLTKPMISLVQSMSTLNLW